MPVNETVLASEVYDRLQEAMAANRADFTELYRDYLSDAWQTLRVLTEAVQQNQMGVVGSKAHYLKSSSLVLGARVVAQRAAVLEELGRNSEITGAGAALERASQALQEVQKELSERLGAEVVPKGQAVA
jgi:HPt (histidine-containing phosphotransfer) domain-containing protein